MSDDAINPIPAVVFSASAEPIPPFDWPVNVFSNFVDRTDDFYTNEVLDPEDPEDSGLSELLRTHIESLLASSEIKFNINFTGTNAEITDVEVIETPGIETKLEYTTSAADQITVLGTTRAIAGEVFEFRRPDGTFFSLDSPFPEDGEGLAIVSWQRPPAPQFRVNTVTVNIVYNILTLADTEFMTNNLIPIPDEGESVPEFGDDAIWNGERVVILNQEQEFTVFQYVYYHLDASLAAFNDLVDRSPF